MTKWTTSARRIAQDYTMAPSCAERIEAALAAAYDAGYADAMVSVIVDTIKESPDDSEAT